MNEVQKADAQRDSVEAARIGNLLSDHLSYLMKLDHLALAEGDGGLRWFSFIDKMSLEVEKLASREAAVIQKYTTLRWSTRSVRADSSPPDQRKALPTHHSTSSCYEHTPSHYHTSHPHQSPSSHISRPSHTSSSSEHHGLPVHLSTISPTSTSPSTIFAPHSPPTRAPQA